MKGAQLVAVLIGGPLVQVLEVLHGRDAPLGGLLGDIQLLHKLNGAWTLIGELVGAAVMTLTEKGFY